MHEAADRRGGRRRDGAGPPPASLGRIAAACVAGIAALFAVSIAVVHRLTQPEAARATAQEHATAPREPAADPDPSAGTAGSGAAGIGLARPTPLPSGIAAAGAAPVPASAPDPLAAAAAAIRISFQMDPRLTRGLQMGERWVSPARFTRTLDASGVGLVVRARVLDGRGRPLEAEPTWTSAQAEVVGVWPARGGTVAIVPQHEGRTTVTVTAGRASRELTVSAARQGGGWKVDVSQERG